MIFLILIISMLCNDKYQISFPQCIDTSRDISNFNILIAIVPNFCQSRAGSSSLSRSPDRSPIGVSEFSPAIYDSDTKRQCTNFKCNVNRARRIALIIIVEKRSESFAGAGSAHFLAPSLAHRSFPRVLNALYKLEIRKLAPLVSRSFAREARHIIDRRRSNDSTHTQVDHIVGPLSLYRIHTVGS